MKKYSALLTVGLLATGCMQPQPPLQQGNSPYTHGNVQLTLKKNETTKAEVLESFGSPNIATTDGDGNEVWTYQKHASVSQSSASSTYGTIILFGGSARKSGFEQSSRTMTLIIKFGKDDKVVDFKSMASSF